jgi:hypothetical protein
MAPVEGEERLDEAIDGPQEASADEVGVGDRGRLGGGVQVEARGAQALLHEPRAAAPGTSRSQQPDWAASIKARCELESGCDVIFNCSARRTRTT